MKMYNRSLTILHESEIRPSGCTNKKKHWANVCTQLCHCAPSVSSAIRKMMSWEPCQQCDTQYNTWVLLITINPNGGSSPEQRLEPLHTKQCAKVATIATVSTTHHARGRSRPSHLRHDTGRHASGLGAPRSQEPGVSPHELGSHRSTE